MKIDNLKQLQGLIRLCKKLGVRAMKIDNIEFTVDASTPRYKARSDADDAASVFPEAAIKVPRYTPVEPDKIETDELSEEQLMFYSARPEVEEQVEQ